MSSYGYHSVSSASTTSSSSSSTTSTHVRFESTNRAHLEVNCRNMNGRVTVLPKIPCPAAATISTTMQQQQRRMQHHHQQQPQQQQQQQQQHLQVTPQQLLQQQLRHNWQRCRDELQQVGTERLQLLQEMSPLYTPPPSPNTSPGEPPTQQNVRLSQRGGYGINNNNPNGHPVSLLVSQVVHELRELGGVDLRSNVAGRYQCVCPLLLGLRTVLARLSKAKAVEDRLTHRVKAVGQMPPNKAELKRCQEDLNDALKGLAEQLRKERKKKDGRKLLRTFS